MQNAKKGRDQGTRDGVSVGEQTLPASAWRQLFRLRTVAVAGQASAILVARYALDMGLPLRPLALVLSLLAALQWGLAWRLGRLPVPGAAWFATVLVADIAGLTALLYLTGGFTNPFVSLYLVPIALAAALLPGRLSWLVTGAALLGYGLLTQWYHPLPQYQGLLGNSMQLHMGGMWVSFMIAALLLAGYLGSMARQLRQRDSELARAREMTMRQERVVALGAQAAGVAHELATPLSSIAVVVGEASRVLPREHELQPELAIVQGQIEACRGIIDRALGRNQLGGGDFRTGDGTSDPALGEFVEGVVATWRQLRPEATARTVVSQEVTDLPVAAPEALGQCLLTLLNNAADASDEAVTLECRLEQGGLRIVVEDRGVGGHSPQAPGRRRDGFGVGLLLAESLLGQFSGSLARERRVGGGTRVVLSLPVARAAQPAALG